MARQSSPYIAKVSPEKNSGIDAAVFEPRPAWLRRLCSGRCGRHSVPVAEHEEVRGIVSKIRDNALTTRCERVIRAEAALKAKVWRRKGRPKAIEPRDIDVPGT